MRLKEGIEALDTLKNRLIFFLHAARLEKNYSLSINKDIYLFFKEEIVHCVASPVQLTFCFEIRRLNSPSDIQIAIIRQIVFDILDGAGISSENAHIELDLVYKVDGHRPHYRIELKILLPIEP